MGRFKALGPERTTAMIKRWNEGVLADWERELLGGNEYDVDQEIRYAAMYDRLKRLKDPKHVDFYGVKVNPEHRSDPLMWDWPGGEQ